MQEVPYVTLVQIGIVIQWWECQIGNDWIWWSSSQNVPLKTNQATHFFGNRCCILFAETWEMGVKASEPIRILSCSHAQITSFMSARIPNLICWTLIDAVNQAFLWSRSGVMQSCEIRTYVSQIGLRSDWYGYQPIKILEFTDLYFQNLSRRLSDSSAVCHF